MPYIYSHAAAVSFDGSTLMRPLVFDFADDAQALAQKYEYMFGKALLVSPITEPGVATWRTYLPHNVGGWYDLRTNRHYDGESTIETEAQHVPVFARAGSIVPMATVDKQYSADRDTAALAINVFPGADATFTLYEDDGTTLAYEQGRLSRITFTWDDRSHRLTIGRREGSYAQMPQHRTFHIVLPDGQKTTVYYKGKKMVCRF
jgi:alpha-D-xyloside xylohydrolase